MSDILQSPIEFLKGVGPMRAELLRSELRIFTFEDLLQYYPFRHIDRSQFYAIRDVDPNAALVQIKGKFVRLDGVGAARTTRMVGAFQDEHGGLMEVVWFRGISWIKTNIKTNTEYVLFGKPGIFNNKIQMTHPEIELYTDFNKPLKGGLEGVYNTTEKLKARKIDSRAIRKMQEAALPQALPYVNETIPGYIRKKYELLTKREAIKEIHFPTTVEHLAQAQKTLKFEELFYISMRLMMIKEVRNQEVQGFVFGAVGNHFNDFYKNHLPFPLTGAQKRVIKEIRADMGSGKQMNRLLQGDVGSGKTIT
ncbi:MAG: ATP-dependent DNA helicase RecG, partial [Salibacteraceae bacterium]|nr:ATP-dependent DNA helicase RecG [Salibacteraceae bacterium]